MDSEQLLRFIDGLIEEFKGQDRTILKVTDVCDFTDYFVIATGTSTRHLQSVAEELIFKCKHAGEPAYSIEGLEAGEWCLLDFGSVIVHLFLAEKRAEYNLEDLWKDGDKIQLGREEA